VAKEETKFIDYKCPRCDGIFFERLYNFDGNEYLLGTSDPRKFIVAPRKIIMQCTCSIKIEVDECRFISEEKVLKKFQVTKDVKVIS
jgi:hypothetical protein